MEGANYRLCKTASTTRAFLSRFRRYFRNSLFVPEALFCSSRDSVSEEFYFKISFMLWDGDFYLFFSGFWDLKLDSLLTSANRLYSKKRKGPFIQLDFLNPLRSLNVSFITSKLLWGSTWKSSSRLPRSQAPSDLGELYF